MLGVNHVNRCREMRHLSTWSLAVVLALGSCLTPIPPTDCGGLDPGTCDSIAQAALPELPAGAERLVIAPGRGLTEHWVVVGCYAEGSSVAMVDVFIDSEGVARGGLREELPNLASSFCDE
ncbi:MAG TPA: hypothetical protein VFW95_08535 [Candidatus Limnocylindria bacterium]|nr:hypothetical protein [Candidatus Limnocylindria bacterium]